MKNLFSLILALLVVGLLRSQTDSLGHYNNSPFKQLKEELPAPNMFRTGSGAPGPYYYQQQADYVINVRLNAQKNRIYGEETITYQNFSPDALEYLWIQLDQNIRTADSPSKLLDNEYVPSKVMTVAEYSQKYRESAFDGGFKLDYVKDLNGKDLPIFIHQTMMRINLDKPLKTGESYSFKIKWWYNINDYTEIGGRSGYESFKDGDHIYVIAQFFPRMAVYSDVEGWQNLQFWGRSEFALPFGNYDVKITVPEDHVLNATGELQNPQQVLSKIEHQRWQEAKKSYDKPLFIVNQNEVETKLKTKKATNYKTWHFKANMVRDFAFSSSRRFIWDEMAVKLNDKTVMAVSLYPPEGNPLWEDYSTRVVAHTLKEYSKMTFDYPYHKAISVNAKNQGMEYPMICWNYGRPNEDGFIPSWTKYGMISVIIHEIGHNFFPMIVNSDERQWTWMDEGLNTFLQYVAEQNFHNSFPNEFKNGENYPSRRGNPQDIIEYMSMGQNVLMPIMTQVDHAYNFGANAYAKPATGLVILRNSVMGPEMFDYAFKTYANRWKFKHPTPADFFRTMEDASAMDLDWFWRGWFYTTWYVDMGVEEVQQYYLKPSTFNNQEHLSFTQKKGEVDENVFERLKKLSVQERQNYVRQESKNPRYFYSVLFSKPGKMIMPLVVKFEFVDGSSEIIRYPYMVWQQKEFGARKFYAFEKELKKIIVDPNLEFADIDSRNNTWEIQ